MSYQKLYAYLLFTLSSLSHATYWEDQYSSTIYTSPTTSALQHHSSQNYVISRDFLHTLAAPRKAYKLFVNSLGKSSRLLEVDCGSGEMLQFVAQKFPHLQMLGIDISQNGIDYANQHNTNPKISYLPFDALNNSLGDNLGTFDIAICSNTLEHFKQPFVLLDNILDACSACIVLVPYKQPITDGYEMEGGAGHVYTFDEHSFANYKVISWFTFSTAGWTWSSKGEEPLQLAILVTKKAFGHENV